MSVHSSLYYPDPTKLFPSLRGPPAAAHKLVAAKTHTPRITLGLTLPDTQLSWPSGGH